jgi:hypothetical protein
MRYVAVTIESFNVVEKLPQILEATRRALSWLRNEWEAGVMISLRVPKRKATKAEKQLEEQFEREQDDAEFERMRREQDEYLDRLHRYELKKQEGGKIKPEEFAAPAPTPLPAAPWEREDEDDDSADAGDIAVKKKPEPPPSFMDDDHPLADNYRLMGHVTLSEAWFPNHHQSVLVYLMGRQPDQIIPECKA